MDPVDKWFGGLVLPSLVVALLGWLAKKAGLGWWGMKSSFRWPVILAVVLAGLAFLPWWLPVPPELIIAACSGGSVIVVLIAVVLVDRHLGDIDAARKRAEKEVSSRVRDEQRRAERNRWPAARCLLPTVLDVWIDLRESKLNVTLKLTNRSPYRVRLDGVRIPEPASLVLGGQIAHEVMRSGVVLFSSGDERRFDLTGNVYASAVPLAEEYLKKHGDAAAPLRISFGGLVAAMLVDDDGQTEDVAITFCPREGVRLVR